MNRLCQHSHVLISEGRSPVCMECGRDPQNEGLRAAIAASRDDDREEMEPEIGTAAEIGAGSFLGWGNNLP